MSEDDITSDNQRRRRARIIDATVEVARNGGYDGVCIQDLAERAQVAKGTLYRYFPSKLHLLLAALSRELDLFEKYLSRAIVGVSDPYRRLQIVIEQLTSGMERTPLLADALTRAFVEANITLTEDVDAVRNQLGAIFADLMSEGQPTVRQREIGAMLTDVWTADMVGLTHGSTSIPEVRQRLCRTTELLAQGDPDAGRGV